MQKNGTHPVAHEGWLTLSILLLAGVISYKYLGLVAAVCCLILFLVCLYIFRNPRRKIPSSPLAVVSPASGKLLGIEEVYDEYLHSKAIRCRVKVTLWDVHAIHSPVEGKVLKQWSVKIDDPGYNRRYSYWVKTDENDDLIFSLVLGKWSPFTRMYIRSGERVGQGQFCGFIYYSGIIEILMPVNSRIVAAPGNHLAGGSDIIGKFIHGNGASVMGK
jgi:phosphatidylserine decarboxylase